MKTKSPEREKARKLYLKSDKTAKNKEIAEKLGVSASLVAKWKSQDTWDSEDLPTEKEKSKGINEHLLFVNRKMKLFFLIHFSF